MSIYGIGIDIVQIDRIESSVRKHGDVFIKKILHDNEYEKYLTLKFKERYLAKRFAAKEAFAKALGTGIAEGITLPIIEVFNTHEGKPEIKLHGRASERATLLGIQFVHLSISDEKEYAVAQVVLEK